MGGNSQDYTIETVEVPRTSFVGLNCVEKFIDWLIENNFVYSEMIFKDDFIAKAKQTSKIKKVTNYIFAHNGFKFDYKFLYE